MTKSPKRQARFQLEGLERRENLSALSVHPHAHVLKGSGTTALVSYANLPGGGIATTSNISGHSSFLGGFSGVLQTTFPPTSGPVQAIVDLVTPAGVLDLSLSGTYHAPRGKSTHSTASYDFSIVNTGVASQGAYGSGHVHLNVNLATGGTTFTLSGKIIE